MKSQKKSPLPTKEQVEQAKKSGMYYHKLKIVDMRRCPFKTGTVLADVWAEVVKKGTKANLSFLDPEPSKKESVKEASE